MQARVETSLLGITPRGLDASGTLHLAILSEQVLGDWHKGIPEGKILR